VVTSAPETQRSNTGDRDGNTRPGHVSGDGHESTWQHLGSPILLAVLAGGLAYNALEYFDRTGTASGLVCDSVQLLMVFVIAGIAGCFLRGRVGAGVARNSLCAAVVCAALSSFVNVTDELRALDGVPFVGAHTTSNEITEVLLMVFALCFLVRAFSAVVTGLVESRAVHVRQAEALRVERDHCALAQRMLSEDRELLRATLESAADGILVTDSAANVTHVNDRFRDMWRIGREALELSDPGLFFEHLYEQTADRDVMCQLVARVKASTRNEFATIAMADGRLFDWHSSPLIRDGAPAGRVCSFRDVTNQRCHESALRLAKETWERTFDTVPEMLCVLDAEHRIEQMNRAMAEHLGVTREDVLGKTCDELFAEGAEAPAWCPLERRALEEDEQDVEVHCEESGRDYHRTTLPLLREDGTLEGTVYVVRDVTARNRAESQRLEFERGLQQTQKLEGLGRLAGGVAHDFNNLLVPVLGNVDFVLEDLPPGAPSRANLEDIRAAAKRAAGLCRQMLAYAGRVGVSIVDTDLYHVIKEMKPLMAASLPAGVCLALSHENDAPLIRGDASQIRQMVMNLVLNAAESMPDGGTVAVSVETLESASWPGHDVQRYAVISVSDRGTGMDREIQRRMFEPFFSTRFTGRGLGLSAVHGIVRTHHGMITVRTREGNGTEVSVFLPALGAASWRRAADALAPAGAGRPVLIVDDESTVLRVAERMVKRLGYAVQCATSGQEAVDMLRASPGAIGCILLDLTMPAMDGEEALAALREIDANVPIVLCSGYAEHRLAKGYEAIGASGFVSKPFNLASLREILARLSIKSAPADR